MHNSNKCIIPECYIDSCLVEVLLVADKDYVNHHKGNGKVAKEMKTTFSNDFCLGIIDEDKESLDYLNFFKEKKSTDYLKLWKHIALKEIPTHLTKQSCMPSNPGMGGKEYW